MKQLKIVQAMLAAALLTISSSALGTTYTGAFDGFVPDNNPAGTSSTISIADAGVITGITVDLAMDHTWIGDLIVTLTSASGTTITLMDRPGASAPGAVGTDVDILSINFDDANLIAAENVMAADFPDLNLFVAPDDALAGLVGESITGDWTLSISDNALLDSNTMIVPTWSLNIETTVVPVPAAVWLMLTALSGLGLLRRRKE